MWNSEKKLWFLINKETNLTQAWMPLKEAEQYPLGQHEWVWNTSMCDYPVGGIVNLSLSICTPGQFMCLSGHCISHHLRCNLRHNCPDGSDEDDCGVVIVNSAYRSYLPPEGVNASTLDLIPAFTVSRFTGIDDVNMIVSVEFYFSLMWRDNRLTFKHLKAEKKGTILYEDDVSKIWKPGYLIVNVDSGREKMLSTAVTITTANNTTAPHYNMVDTGQFLPQV